MEKEESIFFDTTPLFTSFDEHLTEDNKNIIFSAPFGKGKSTFINEYFEKNKEQYNCIKISPVHYSICNNEDIYSLLKYDIICELLDTSDVSNDKEFTCFENIKYNSEEIANIICSTILKNIPKIGKHIDTCTKMISKINTLLKETNKPKSEILNEKVMSLEEYKYFLADDFIVNYCNDKLINIKENDNKTNVLVIDDLDRLDPEHIFRLLNIFSTYTDYSFSGNKYAFDHIIFVCDIDNIRKIYAHKYGDSVDFEGYINKFCTREIFRFDLMEEIRISYDEIFESINNKIYKLYGIQYIKEILFILLENEIINFRDLLNIQNDLNKYSSKFKERMNNSISATYNTAISLIYKLKLDNIIRDRISRNLKFKNQVYTIKNYIFTKSAESKLTKDYYTINQRSNIRKPNIIPNENSLSMYLHFVNLLIRNSNKESENYIKLFNSNEEINISISNDSGLFILNNENGEEIPTRKILVYPLQIIKDFFDSKINPYG